ncbi:MAG TPA: hypothetical protein ENI61_04010 [Ignavibacteria bacterium]|nr:hypothetical protein [Ignavibacteria bacterium]
MITQKQKAIKAIIGFIIAFITFNVAYYILYLLWGGEKINLPVAVLVSVTSAFYVYKRDKVDRFFKRIQGRVVTFIIHKKNK